MRRKVSPAVVVLAIVMAMAMAGVVWMRALNKPVQIAQDLENKRRGHLRDQQRQGTRGNRGGPNRAGGQAVPAGRRG